MAPYFSKISLLVMVCFENTQANPSWPTQIPFLSISLNTTMHLRVISLAGPSRYRLQNQLFGFSAFFCISVFDQQLLAPSAHGLDLELEKFQKSNCSRIVVESCRLTAGVKNDHWERRTEH